jgi:hypothetical protein
VPHRGYHRQGLSTLSGGTTLDSRYLSVSENVGVVYWIGPSDSISFALGCAVEDVDESKRAMTRVC